MEIADGGTVLIDNIHEMPQGIQTKMINFLSSSTYCPVGTSRPLSSDVRILGASSRSIEAISNDTRIKKDLIYRLNVIPVHLSSLRERKDDIEILTMHFVNTYGSKRSNSGVNVEEAVMDAFLLYSWPGNVAELKGLVERLVTLSDGKIKVSDLPRKYLEDTGTLISTENLNFVSSPSIMVTESGVDLNNIIKDIEDNLIKQALDMTSWNKNRAAKLLGLNRTTLVEKLRKRGLINTRIKD